MQQNLSRCQENLPDFISATEWPASSPDANPLDYSIWGYMLSFLKDLKNVTLPKLKARIVKIWNKIPMEVVRAACDTFPTRLEQISQAQGERIELNY